MQNVFEKIKERLVELGKLDVRIVGGRCNGKTLELGYRKGVSDAIEIVDQVAKEFADDTNVGRKNGWIPCSEKVPNYEEAWYHNEEDHIYEPNEFIVMIKGAEIPTVLFYDTAFEEWTDGCDNVYEVIAWQPLPEPYKEKK